MNNILKNFKEFCKIYINDVVIFNKILKKHVEHLRLTFDLFDSLNINLFSIKIFSNISRFNCLHLKLTRLNYLHQKKS